MAKELEEKFFFYYQGVRDSCRKLKWDLINTTYINQLIRSSAYVGANYLEAADSLGKGDERIKIARREAIQSVYLLRLILTVTDNNLAKERNCLIKEGNQIQKILSLLF